VAGVCHQARAGRDTLHPACKPVNPAVDPARQSCFEWRNAPFPAAAAGFKQHPCHRAPRAASPILRLSNPLSEFPTR
jgi:hypothetical protein